jgi:tRNA-2-methylthio-N6-dimethylallyladenosine synthase
MNFHDSERLAGLLESQGYSRTDLERDAELVVLNTCSVRERAEEKLYSRLGEIRDATADRPEGPPVIAVAGCVAQQEGTRLLKRRAGIDVIVGTQSLKELPVLVDQARESRSPRVDINPHDDISFPLGMARHSDPIRASVTIIEGCNEFCAFCVVPYTRGHERMRPAADILAEVREAVRSGHREIQLLGQIVNHYQAPDDAACDFAGLLERVSAIPGVLRVRFASPHPRHVTTRLIDAIRDLPVVCKHLHLPVQSGSNRVLKAMRRRYTREEYLALVDRLRDQVPGIELSSDVIVGFPGETAEDFAETLDLTRRSQFQAIYSFKYSVRPNTLANQRLPDDVTEADKTSRIVELQALQRDIQIERHGRMIGATVDVLVDSTSRRRDWELAGRTSGNMVVNLPGPADWIGRVLPVRLTGSGAYSLRGDALTSDARAEEAPVHAH